MTKVDISEMISAIGLYDLTNQRGLTLPSPHIVGPHPDFLSTLTCRPVISSLHVNILEMKYCRPTLLIDDLCKTVL